MHEQEKGGVAPLGFLNVSALQLVQSILAEPLHVKQVTSHAVHTPPVS